MIVLTLARKPLTGTVASTLMAHGTGSLNIGASRVGLAGGTRRDGKADKPNGAGWENMKGHGIATLNSGRWPANILFEHRPGCMQAGTRTVKGGNDPHRKDGTLNHGTFWRDPTATTVHASGHAGFSNEDGTETVASWNCDPDCPVKALEGQSEFREVKTARTSTALRAAPVGTATSFSMSKQGRPHMDAGTASRFFHSFGGSPS